MMTAQVLIIEDDTMLSTMYRHALKTVQYDAVVIADGEVAWQTVGNYQPALILLDMNLPGRDGHSIYEKICELPQFEKIPVIICTANGVMADAMEHQLRDTDFVMMKPLNISELVMLVQRLGRS
jgi:DNA-binding response OmpR family regulator